MAIAVGKLESQRIGPRSQVWSENECLEKAAYDFAKTEDMLYEAEKICGPYVWGIYDILVLPPSFPHRGMENPCMTFVSPTLLTGDRSLSGVIAHEIAHSWTGNLITNKNFEHFWLNEGFTVFIEHKIVGRMSGEPARHFCAILRQKELKYSVLEVQGKDNVLTKLIVDLDGVDPDEAFSSVPYVKGSIFLWYLEDMVGGPDIFEPFLRCYFDHFMYQSIDSYQFKDFFLAHFKDKDLSFIEWENWFKQPGMPIYEPNYDQSMALACNTLKQKWIDWKESKELCPLDSYDFFELSSLQKIEFLGQLLEEKPLSIEKLKKMEKLYELSSHNNSEIKFKWIRLGLKGKWIDAIPRATSMMNESGLLKFVRPLYR